MKNFIILLLISSFAMTGCARARVVESPLPPHESLGLMEIGKSVKTPWYMRVMSLGLYRRYSVGHLQKSITNKITRKAKKRYGAEAVADMHFWPDADADVVIDAVYGRGEMIKYKKFPADQSPAPVAAA